MGIWARLSNQGMVGRALVRLLQQFPHVQLLLREKTELDLTRQAAVEQFLAAEQPDWVIIAAAKVGGIVANQRFPADFLYQNLLIESNLVHYIGYLKLNHNQEILFAG